MDCKLTIEESRIEEPKTYTFGNIPIGGLFRLMPTSIGKSAIYLRIVGMDDWNAIDLSNNKLEDFFDSKVVEPYRGRLTIEKAV